jgi:hypothetical protein
MEGRNPLGKPRMHPVTDCRAERSREPPLEVELLSNKGADRLVVLFPLVAVHFLRAGRAPEQARARISIRALSLARRLRAVPSAHACIDVGARFEVRFCNTGSRDFVSLASFFSISERREADSPASMLMTLSKIFSTLWTGLHRSLALSYELGSSPGACRIEMHTSPFA